MARPSQAPIAPTRASAVSRKRPALKDTTNTEVNRSRIGVPDHDATTPAEKRRGPKAQRQNSSRTAADVELPGATQKPSRTRRKVKSPVTVPHATGKTPSADIPRPSTRGNRAPATGENTIDHRPSDHSPLTADLVVSDVSHSTTLSLDLSSSPSTHDDMTRLSIINLQASNYRLQTTPSADASSLALKNFRRRPRQGSILGLVRQRLASADNSAVHIANDESVESLESLDSGTLAAFDEDDFRPEAWGTPMGAAAAHTRLSQPLSNHQDLSTSGPEQGVGHARSRRKRGSDHMDASIVSSPQSSTSRKRRQLSSRKSTPTRNGTRPSPIDLPNELPSINADKIQIANSQPSSHYSGSPQSSSAIVDSQIIIKSTQELGPLTGEADDLDGMANSVMPTSTMADPLSSSPAPNERTTKPLASRGAKLARQDPGSPSAHRTVMKSKKTSTATLQSLLPRRRQPVRGTRKRGNALADVAVNTLDSIAVASDESDNDESDEIYDGAHASRRIRTEPAQQRSKNVQNAARKRMNTSKMSTASRIRTYGRARVADQGNNENEAQGGEIPSDDEDAPELSMIEAAQSGELQEARQRFADVDNWDMEFESVSVDEDRSSSQAWR